MVSIAQQSRFMRDLKTTYRRGHETRSYSCSRCVLETAGRQRHFRWMQQGAECVRCAVGITLDRKGQKSPIRTVFRTGSETRPCCKRLRPFSHWPGYEAKPPIEVGVVERRPQTCPTPVLVASLHGEVQCPLLIAPSRSNPTRP